MKRTETALLSIHFSYQELLEELNKRTSYLVHPFIKDPEIAEAHIITTDEFEFAEELLKEGYCKICDRIAAHLYPNEEELPYNDICFEIIYPKSMGKSGIENIKLNLKQGLVFYAIHRWLADKNVDLAGYHLSLFDLSISEIIRSINRRLLSRGRTWGWW